METVGEKNLPKLVFYPDSSEKPHSRQTKRTPPRLPVTIPIVTPQAGQIGGRSSGSGGGFLTPSG
jgi:hypothetical protein